MTEVFSSLSADRERGDRLRMRQYRVLVSGVLENRASPMDERRTSGYIPHPSIAYSWCVIIRARFLQNVFSEWIGRGIRIVPGG